MIDFNRKKCGRSIPRPPGLLLPELGIKTVPVLVPPRMRHGDEPNPSWFREFIIDIEFADRVPEAKWTLNDDRAKVIRWGSPVEHRTNAEMPTRNENIGAFIWRLSGQAMPDSMTIDHIRHDIYDNRLSNLRPLDRPSQLVSRRGYGAVKRKYITRLAKPKHPGDIARPYKVRIPDRRIGGKQKWVGRYATEREAVEVRNSMLEGMLPDDMYAIVMPIILAEPPLDEEGS